MLEEEGIDPAQPNLTAMILDVVCKLYPAGLRDKDVWNRSGGDLSRVNLFGSGLEQWSIAIRLIKSGGVSEEGFKPLLVQIQKDFPGNGGVKLLFEQL